MSEWKEWPRAEQVLLYVIGLLDDLKDRRLVVGGKFSTSKGGRKIFEAMKADGFRATEQEIQSVMKAIVFPH